MADPAERVQAFFAELRRRRVFRVAVVYAVAAWVVIQVAVATFPVLLLPPWMTRAVVVIAAMGFPVAVALAWAFRVSPEESDPDRAAVDPTPGERDAGDPDPAARPSVSDGRPLARAGLVLVVLLASVAAGMAAWQGWHIPGAATGSTDRPGLDPYRIGVLYFDNYAPDPELGAVADAFTESLIHELAQVEALDVVSRNGVKPYRDPDQSLDSIARVLGAGHLVEGSVERSGNRFRVHVQLIDGETATHLSSTVIERSGEDLLSIRDEVVEEVARLLQKQLGEELEIRRTRSDTRVTEAWALFHRARDIAEFGDSLRLATDLSAAREAFREADSLLARAESLDPTWPAPTVERGWIAYSQAFLTGPLATDLDPGALRRGLDHANRPLSEDPDHPGALELRGALRYRMSGVVPADSAPHVIGEAETDLRRAVDADAGRTVAWIYLADLLVNQGRLDEARLAFRRSAEADPFLARESELLSLAANIAVQLEDFDRAWELVRDGLTRFPGNPYFGNVALTILAGANAPGADIPVDSAWAMLDRVEDAMPQVRWGEGELLVAAILAKQRSSDSARAVMQRATTGARKNPYTHYYEANVHLQLGDRDSALRSLGEALTGAPQFKGIAAADWWWHPLRDDPRFRALTGFDSAESRDGLSRVPDR